ncbi:MAG: hypothetical protein ACPGWR_21755, partial [Ardenticatenaceae bacterium]
GQSLAVALLCAANPEQEGKREALPLHLCRGNPLRLPSFARSIPNSRIFSRMFRLEQSQKE